MNYKTLTAIERVNQDIEDLFGEPLYTEEEVSRMTLTQVVQTRLMTEDYKRLKEYQRRRSQEERERGNTILTEAQAVRELIGIGLNHATIVAAARDLMESLATFHNASELAEDVLSAEDELRAALETIR